MAAHKHYTEVPIVHIDQAKASYCKIRAAVVPLD